FTIVRFVVEVVVVVEVSVAPDDSVPQEAGQTRPSRTSTCKATRGRRTGAFFVDQENICFPFSVGPCPYSERHRTAVCFGQGNESLGEAISSIEIGVRNLTRNFAISWQDSFRQGGHLNF